MTEQTLADFASNPTDPVWGLGPLLVVRPSSKSHGRQSQPTEETNSPFMFDTPSRQTITSNGVASGKIEPGTIGDYLSPCAQVIPICKTTGNPFPLISVGRARNNDVCVADSSVSKVHAYFVCPGKDNPSWGLKDAKSLNGTAFLLASGPCRLAEEVVAIMDGQEIRFGAVRCLFVDRETLANAVAWAAKSWKRP